MVLPMGNLHALGGFELRTRLYSRGKTLTNLGSICSQFSRIQRARGLAVASAWRAIRAKSISESSTADSRSTLAVVAALDGEVAGFIEHVGDAAAHAGGEVAAALAEHDDQAVGHVFAAVIAEAFDDGGGAGVAHGEALAGACR